MTYSGYSVKIGEVLQGKCVSHEVDIVAIKNGEHIVAECKFHSEKTNTCNVKVPLYINSRYRDIIAKKRIQKNVLMRGGS